MAETTLADKDLPLPQQFWSLQSNNFGQLSDQPTESVSEGTIICLVKLSVDCNLTEFDNQGGLAQVVKSLHKAIQFDSNEME